MTSGVKKFPATRPQPVYEWLPTAYDLDKKFSSYRGEKWLADQSSFMMEIMKFMPNIDKESFRKGTGQLINNSFNETDPSWEIGSAKPAAISNLPGNIPANYAAESKKRIAYEDYLERVYGYDHQYVGATYNGRYTGSDAGDTVTVGARAFYGTRAEAEDIQPGQTERPGFLFGRHTYETTTNRFNSYGLQYANSKAFQTNAWAFSRGHSLAYGGALNKIEGYGSGGAVAEQKQYGKEKIVYDFYKNFWDFGGAYKDYFSDYKNGNRRVVEAQDQKRGSFFVRPSDITGENKNEYRVEFQDRGTAAIPIFSAPEDFGGGKKSYFNAGGGKLNGQDISKMSAEEFLNLYPQDYTMSYYGRNPALLNATILRSAITNTADLNHNNFKNLFQFPDASTLIFKSGITAKSIENAGGITQPTKDLLLAALKDNGELPSLTGYGDRINKVTNKTHFQEAVEYFQSYATAENPRTGKPYGTAWTIDNNERKQINSAGFYDLMMDPDAPWNIDGEVGNSKGNGWWAERQETGNTVGSVTNVQFENMKAAFYMMILALEAGRRAMHATTQWFGPSTQLQGFSFTSTYRHHDRDRVYIKDSDKYMIEYFKWYGEDSRQRQMGRRPDKNIYWRSAEAPQFRAEFNNVFKTSIHELYRMLRAFGGDVNGQSWVYSKADDNAMRNLASWMKTQIDRLMTPSNLITRSGTTVVQATTLAYIHPDVQQQTSAEEAFQNFITTTDPYTASNTTGAIYDSTQNKFVDNTTLTVNGGSVTWGWLKGATAIIEDPANHDTIHQPIIDYVHTLWQANTHLSETAIYNAYVNKLVESFVDTNSPVINNPCGSKNITGLGDKTVTEESGMTEFRNYVLKKHHELSIDGQIDVGYSQPHDFPDYTCTYGIAPDQRIRDIMKWYKDNRPETYDAYAPYVAKSLGGTCEGTPTVSIYAKTESYYSYNSSTGRVELDSSSITGTNWVNLPVVRGNVFGQMPADTSSTGTYYTTEHTYIPVESKTYYGIDYNASYQEKYNLVATTQLFESPYTEINQNGTPDIDKEQWSKGHNISLVSGNTESKDGGTLTLNKDYRVDVNYRDATEFRAAYLLFKENATDPYDEMSLSTYRMERDKQAGATGPLTIEEYIDTNRWAHQWYRKRTDLQKILGLDGNPELKRLYAGGALAELYREFKKSDDDTIKMLPLSTDPSFPTLTPAITGKFAATAWAQWNVTTTFGHWSLYSGNLRLDGNTSRIAQLSGYNVNNAKKQTTIYYYDEAGNIQSRQGTPFEDIWGLSEDYQMFNTSAFSVAMMMYQQVNLKNKIRQFKEDSKQFAEDKYQENYDKSREEAIAAKKKGEQAKTVQKAAKKSSDARQRLLRLQAKSNKKRKVDQKTSQQFDDLIGKQKLTAPRTAKK